MNDLIIKEDRIKLTCYTIMNLVLTILLMFIIAFTYFREQYLFAFLAITGLWFSVKYMCKYGIKLIKNEPLCTFMNSKVVSNELPNTEEGIKYKEMKEVKILKNS